MRLELAYLYRQIGAGKITSQDGARCAYILRQIADVLTVAEIERRLEQLEERQTTKAMLPDGSHVAARMY